MAGDGRGRLVYASGRGRICPTCGWPVGDCRCSARQEQPVPSFITATLRLERKGRGGKSVTVLDGLPRNRAFLRELAGELKRLCGSGGAVGDGSVELQGDQRVALRAALAARGWKVRG